MHQQQLQWGICTIWSSDLRNFVDKSKPRTEKQKPKPKSKQISYIIAKVSKLYRIAAFLSHLKRCKLSKLCNQTQSIFNSSSNLLFHLFSVQQFHTCWLFDSWLNVASSLRDNFRLFTASSLKWGSFCLDSLYLFWNKGDERRTTDIDLQFQSLIDFSSKSHNCSH